MTASYTIAKLENACLARARAKSQFSADYCATQRTMAKAYSEAGALLDCTLMTSNFQGAMDTIYDRWTRACNARDTARDADLPSAAVDRLNAYAFAWGESYTACADAREKEVLEGRYANAIDVRR